MRKIKTNRVQILPVIAVALALVAVFILITRQHVFVRANADEELQNTPTSDVYTVTDSLRVNKGLESVKKIDLGEVQLSSLAGQDVLQAMLDKTRFSETAKQNFLSNEKNVAKQIHDFTDQFTKVEISENCTGMFLEEESAERLFLEILNGNNIYRFDENAELVGFRRMSYPYTSSQLSEEEAEKLSRQYAEKIGMDETYQLIYTVDICHMYLFQYYKEVEAGVVSETDEYRIGVSAENGELSNFSYRTYPIEIPEAVPRLSLEQALMEAQARLPEIVQADYSITGELTVNRPNHFYEELVNNEIYYRAPYSRFAWKLSVRDSRFIVYVDAYSGEILGGHTLPMEEGE